MRELVLAESANTVTRSNPDAGDVVDIAKRGLAVAAGFGGANWLATMFPKFVKHNPLVDGLATLATAFLPQSFRAYVPGGAEVFNDLSAGMAAAGAVKLVKPYVTHVPGFRYLPAAAGGGAALPPRPTAGQLPARPIPLPRAATVTAIRAPLGIS